jgi:hypothetical protein
VSKFERHKKKDAENMQLVNNPVHGKRVLIPIGREE